MYFPYMRGNLNELFAVSELAKVTAGPGLVLPIFRVEKMDAHLYRRLEVIVEQGQRIAVIANAVAPESQTRLSEFVRKLLLEFPTLVIPAFEICSGDMNVAAKIFVRSFGAEQVMLVHRMSVPAHEVHRAFAKLQKPAIHVYFQAAHPEASQHGLASCADVVISDPFMRKAKNGLYPAQSPFSSAFGLYRQAGFLGFGDFGIVGDYYKAGGGRASNVALHLTERLRNKFVCNHFVSDDHLVDSHIHFQYADALDKLRAYVGNPPSPGFGSSGLIDGYLVDGAFHTLGVAKRWSLKGHIHTMQNALMSVNAPRAI
ncbi:sce7725 family protein [Stenotrophomonas sp.]|uniref:sce7725 family protein n=1 Tax=Stenotrophomonas sp. TaxID=69392 RepID=UPI00289A2749|nr:sce7725 family protein [Stenotrophomonas sp.]